MSLPLVVTSASGSETHTFLADNTLTIPDGFTTMTLRAQGGGGGGGSGSFQLTTIGASGGGGGTGGNYGATDYTIADIGGSGTLLNITVGQGGTGGGVQVAVSNNGFDGVDGTASKVVRNSDSVVLIQSNGGSKGLKGSTTVTGASVANPTGQWIGGNGGNGPLATVGGAGVTSNVAAGGGGGGGATDTATDVERAGGVGSYGYQGILALTTTLPAGGTTPGGNGNNGLANTLLTPGSGASGGAGGATVAGGTGGTGGNYGAGGGGGGGTIFGPSGAGGDGADGFVQIIFF